MISILRPARALTRRRAFALAAGATVLGIAPVAAQTGTPVAVPADFKVVLHAAEAGNWGYVQSNVRNLQAEWPAAQIRVVVDGSAVTSLAGPSDLATFLSDAVNHGLALAVCPNALKEHGIAPDQMPTGATTALGGVIALVQAAHEGFVYIKP